MSDLERKIGAQFFFADVDSPQDHIRLVRRIWSDRANQCMLQTAAICRCTLFATAYLNRRCIAEPGIFTCFSDFGRFREKSSANVSRPHALGKLCISVSVRV